MEDRFASVDGLRRFDFAAEAMKRLVIFQQETSWTRRKFAWKRKGSNILSLGETDQGMCHFARRTSGPIRERSQRDA